MILIPIGMISRIVGRDIISIFLMELFYMGIGNDG